MKKLFCIILGLVIISCSDTKKVKQVPSKKDGTYIWHNFVPESGQATFVQGELIRANEKLRDEAHRYGNINFNDSCHLVLIKYLRDKLTDTKLFSATIIAQIHKDLDRLKIENQPYTDNDLFDRIEDRIIDWYYHYGDGIQHTHNPELHC